MLELWGGPLDFCFSEHVTGARHPATAVEVCFGTAEDVIVFVASM